MNPGGLCSICNYCYATGAVDGKPTCDRCRQDYDIRNEPKRSCPLDGVQMNKLADHGVVLDVCPTCQGIWIDGYERELLRNAIRESGFRSGRLSLLLWGMIIAD